MTLSRLYENDTFKQLSDDIGEASTLNNKQVTLSSADDSEVAKTNILMKNLLNYCGEFNIIASVKLLELHIISTGYGYW